MGKEDRNLSRTRTGSRYLTSRWHVIERHPRRKEGNFLVWQHIIIPGVELLVHISRDNYFCAVVRGRVCNALEERRFARARARACVCMCLNFLTCSRRNVPQLCYLLFRYNFFPNYARASFSLFQQHYSLYHLAIQSACPSVCGSDLVRMISPAPLNHF